MAREEWEADFFKALPETGNKVGAAKAAGIHRNTVNYHLGRDQSFAARVQSALGQTLKRGAAVVLLALCLVAPSMATITSAPVQLGSAGLTLAVGLLRWQESAPDTWTSYSNAGVTVNDLTGGNYTVSGLPVATGTDRFSVTLYLASDLDSGLMSYVYGAQPGTRVVWQEVITLPSSPIVFRQGDTFGSLAITVVRNLPAAACEPETEATFSAATASTGVALFSDRAAVISNCELDATSGTYGATFTYDLQSGDTAALGKYVGAFEVCYSPTSCHSLPATNILRWEVVKAIGG